jgi:uncharacterized protein YifE (UPF0438 family)
MSFNSDKHFNNYQKFPRGLRRSGYFTIKESTVLEECGQAMSELYEGKRKPKTPEEKTFVAQIALIRKQIEDRVETINVEVVEDFNTRCWAKYLKVMLPNRVHHLGPQTTGQDDASSDGTEE